MSTSSGLGIARFKLIISLLISLLLAIASIIFQSQLNFSPTETLKELGNVGQTSDGEEETNDNSTRTERKGRETNRRDIYFQNQPIGTALLLCQATATSTSTSNATTNNEPCNVLKPPAAAAAAAEMEDGASFRKCSNINGPTVIRKGLIFHLFVSGHKDGTDIRRFEAASAQGPWQEANLEMPSFDRCKPGLHSPDIILFHGTYYMLAHGHGCEGIHVKRKQPTVTLTSNDLVHWVLPTKTYAANEYFYMRVFVHNNLFYAIAKSQEDSVGSMVLLRSESPFGPFEYVKSLAPGVRHVSLHRKGAILFVFFTIIGDLPERILLGTINLDEDEDMKLRPGPILLEPPHDGNLVPSRSGPASCDVAPQFRDPFFVPDSNEGEAELRGIVYFADRELTIGAARLFINLTQYFHAVQYRNITLVDRIVFQSSSLSYQDNAPERPLLITGVGRSGTTFTCHFFNQLGWNISHDNGLDCGPFPGTFGSSSWYHAFKTPSRGKISGREPLRAKQVVHLVRDPLANVKSRASRALVHSNMKFVYKVASMWEDTKKANFDNATMVVAFSLRHWVHRNSFVSKHAEWRVKIEDLASDPLHTWMLCLEVGRDDCPRLDVIRPVLEAMDHSINSDGKLQDGNQEDITWWMQLADIDEDIVRIALKMASEYGYKLDKRLEEMYRVPEVSYTCQFHNEEAARSGHESPRQWGCSLLVVTRSHNTGVASG